MPSEYFWILLNNIFLILACYHGPIIKWPPQIASSEWGPEQERALQQVRVAVPAALPLGPWDPADSMVAEVLPAGRDAVWGLWQVPINELWLRSLRFWSKTPNQVTTLLFRNSYLSATRPYRWSFNTLATWCKQLTHWKRPWCWERLRAGEEEGGRGWDGWMASPIQWTWTWANSGRWWGTGRPGMLQSMRLQRAGHNLVTEQQQNL